MSYRHYHIQDAGFNTQDLAAINWELQVFAHLAEHHRQVNPVAEPLFDNERLRRSRSSQMV